MYPKVSVVLVIIKKYYFCALSLQLSASGLHDIIISILSSSNPKSNLFSFLIELHNTSPRNLMKWTLKSILSPLQLRLTFYLFQFVKTSI